jgi:hypothetical protein
MKQQILETNAIRQAVISALPDTWVTNTRSVRLFNPPTPKKNPRLSSYFQDRQTHNTPTHRHTHTRARAHTHTQGNS